MSASPTCPRCGGPRPPPAEKVVDEPTEILRLLASMRLCIPDEVRARLTVLAAVLPCLLGTCRPSAAVTAGHVADLDVRRLERERGAENVTRAVVAIAAAGLDDRLSLEKFFELLDYYFADELAEMAP